MEWASASRPVESAYGGDGSLILDCGGDWLVCVVDALGHGLEAAQVKEAALRVVAQNSGREVGGVLSAVHLALQRTRGAAMSLARIPKAGGDASLAAVGNVEMVILGKAGRKYVVGKRGVLGYTMPAIRTTAYPLGNDELIIIFTDGVDSSFLSTTNWRGALPAMAQGIIEGHASAIDDALVLIGRR